MASDYWGGRERGFCGANTHISQQPGAEKIVTRRRGPLPGVKSPVICSDAEQRPFSQWRKRIVKCFIIISSSRTGAVLNQSVLSGRRD